MLEYHEWFFTNAQTLRREVKDAVEAALRGSADDPRRIFVTLHDLQKQGAFPPSWHEPMGEYFSRFVY